MNLCKNFAQSLLKEQLNLFLEPKGYVFVDAKTGEPFEAYDPIPIDLYYNMKINGLIIAEDFDDSRANSMNR